MRRNRAWSWIVIAAVWVFMLAPIAIVIVNSFNSSAISTFPPSSWSVRWFHAALTNPSFRNGFSLSLRVALSSAIVASVVGVGAGYALYRFPSRTRTVLHGLLNTPLGLPKVAVGLAGLITYISITAWISSLKTVVSGATALIVLHAVMALPLVVGVLASSFEAFDRRIEAAARDLGARPVRTFRTVTLPLITPAVLVAFAFAFMVSFDDLESSLFMASQSGNTLPVAMYIYLENSLDPSLAALSTMLLGAIVVLLCLGLPLVRMRRRLTRGAE